MEKYLLFVQIYVYLNFYIFLHVFLDSDVHLLIQYVLLS